MSKEVMESAQWIIQASEFIYHHKNFAAISCEVVQAWLAEHPEDDDEAVSDEWLERCLPVLQFGDYEVADGIA